MYGLYSRNNRLLNKPSNLALLKPLEVDRIRVTQTEDVWSGLTRTEAILSEEACR